MNLERRERVLAGMREDRVDALLLGRPANLRYATGFTPLWLAGARPFAPVGVVLADGQVHLVGASDDGVPPEVDDDRLIPPSWNPATLVQRVAAVVGTPATVGVDGMTPMFERLLTAALPGAEVVDATALLWRARATKTDDEVARLRRACEIAAEALAAVTGALAEGVRERDLLATFVGAMASSGTTLPAFDGTFCVWEPGRPLRRLVSDRAVAAGDGVALDVGVLVDGYEGGLGRTWLPTGSEPTADQRAAFRRARVGLDALLEACRPGVTLAELASVAPDAGFPVAYGIGLGVEPLATEVGSTFCLQVLQEGVLLRETVVLRADGPELLSHFEDGPLG